MKVLQPFKLERYFDRYEFNVPYLLSPSDCESLSLAELLTWADPSIRELWEGLSLGYTEAAGHPLLRQAVASLYTQTSPDQVLILVPEEGIFIAMHTLLEPGDEVICVVPAYQSLHEVARSIGCQVIPWKLKPGSNGWTLDLEQLRELLTDKTRLLVINFPHNPTGFLPASSDLDEIVNIARRYGVYIFSDEMYRLLEYDERLRLPSIVDIYERGISLSGVSKSLALPGLRIGWLANRDNQLRQRWTTFKDYTTICNSAPSEILALIALNARRQILRRNLDIIHTNLSLARKFFTKFNQQFEWLSPQSGSVAFPHWTGPGNIEQLCQELIDHQGLMMVPGSLFDYPGNHFRLGLGRRNFAQSLSRLEDHLGQKY